MLAFLGDTAGIRLVVLVLFRILRVVEVFEDVVRGHDADQLLAQGGLLETVLVLVLAVQLLPGQLLLIVDLQVSKERLEFRLGEALLDRA